MGRITLKRLSKKLIGVFYTGEKKNDFADVDLSQKIPSKVDAENFNLLLAHTHAGNVSVAELVDGMYSLEENLPPHVTDKLFKFLGKDTILTVLLQTMVEENEEEGEEERQSEWEKGVVCSGAKDVSRMGRASYVIHHVFTGGTAEIRRLIVTDSLKFGVLLDYYSTCPAISSLTLTRVTRTILSIMQDFPDEAMRQIGKRKGILSDMGHHLSDSLLVELIAQMFSSSIQQDDAETEVRFGPLNPIGVLTLANSDIYAILAESFKRGAKVFPPTLDSYNMLENSLRCIVLIASRALLTPKLHKGNRDLDKVMMKNINRSLDKLQIFMESSAIELMLDFALDAYDREENEQPITCVLQCLADLSNKLFDVQLNCKEESVRLWARSIDTRDFDERLAQRTDRLVQLLGLDDGVDEVAVQPLGMMRLRVVEFFASRFRCTNAIAIGEMVMHEVPRKLFDLFFSAKHNSVLHVVVARAVNTVMASENEVLTRAYFRDARIIDLLLTEWARYQAMDIQTRNDEIAYMGQVFEMVLSIKSFLDRNSYYNNSERIQVEDLIDQKTMMAFDDFCTSATEYFTNPQVLGGQLPPTHGPSILRTLGPLTRGGSLV